MKKNWYLYLLIISILIACGKNPKGKDPLPKDTGTVKPVDTSGNNNMNNNPGAVSFNEDTAFNYIKMQMSFGPRIPNSKGHKACGDYLISTLKSFADKVQVQSFSSAAFTGEVLKGRNIIARFDEKNANRIVLFAHWDTRPFADRNESTKSQPVPGADDGGSGVGVLLEIARLLKISKPQIGVDIILFDCEDYGDAGGRPETYCLGSQYWAKNPPIPAYAPKYGILLDMVGARSATFMKEGYSRQYAPGIVDKVWNTAIGSGYGAYFVNVDAEPVTDDHYFVNSLAKIPTIDIINKTNTGFGNHWHTPNDNLDIIDKSVLKAVGQTLINVIYTEQ